MPNLPPRLIFAAFVGFVLWTGTALSSASARPAAVRLSQRDACRAVSPTFHPQGRHRARFEAARFPGGARVSFPVAEPCPSRPGRADV